MSSLSSFVKLSNKETILKEWAVLHDRGGFRASDVLAFLVWWFVFWVLQELARGIIAGLFSIPIIGDVLGFLWPILRILMFSFWVPLLAALAVMAFNIFSRPVVNGQVALSNWRLLYYERGEGRLSRFHHAVSSVNLKDIVGVHSDYQEGFWGKKNLAITIHTKHKGGISLRIGHTGLLGKLPLVGILFRRNTMGPDATAMLPEAFRLIQEHKGRVADTSVSY